MTLTLWHVNRDGFVAEPCSLPCALNLKSGDHFTTEFAAQCAADELQSSRETKTPKAPTARKSTTAKKSKKPSSWPNAYDIVTRVYQLSDELYVHPLGKFAVIGANGYMRVYKGSKPAKTGGTVADLRSGRGSWKLAKPAGARFDTREYEKNFSND